MHERASAPDINRAGDAFMEWDSSRYPSSPPDGGAAAALDDVVALILRAIDEGNSEQVAQLVQRFPEYTDSLREFLDDHESLVRLANPIRRVSAAGELDRSARGRMGEAPFGN